MDAANGHPAQRHREGDGDERDDQGHVARAEHLERRRHEHDHQHAPDHAAGQAAGAERAEQDAGDRADEHRRRHGEPEIPEQHVPERGGQDQRHGLHEVGADEPVGAQHRVERQQRDDDERPGADGRQPHDQAADDADRHRRQPADHDLLRVGRTVPGTARLTQ